MYLWKNGKGKPVYSRDVLAAVSKRNMSVGSVAKLLSVLIQHRALTTLDTIVHDERLCSHYILGYERMKAIKNKDVTVSKILCYLNYFPRKEVYLSTRLLSIVSRPLHELGDDLWLYYPEVCWYYSGREASAFVASHPQFTGIVTYYAAYRGNMVEVVKLPFNDILYGYGHTGAVDSGRSSLRLYYESRLAIYNKNRSNKEKYVS